ncbi:hypothetical protein GCM10010211_29900 [Streptomyces albospinus]|uniref:Uncharacterized protein n=1 Tax=Streptomyces albospinus TaxID=285515 RepID=A0ABQ2V337_9ACTN|nr:hypothetical protein GCM10010211_29900 [Streptomyces albospinus]
MCADISWLVGLAVPVVLYGALARRDTARLVAPEAAPGRQTPAGLGG